MIDESLVDFPLLINIFNDENLATYSQDDFDDILFTTNDIDWNTGSTIDRLPHEIESYDNNNGNLTCWINVTYLNNKEDTLLYMYYGNNTCDSMQQPDMVWDSHFTMVQHLNETGTGARYDSTSYENNGSTGGYDGDEASIGMINGADDFDGVDDQLDCGNPGSLNIVDNITVEAWIKPNVLSGRHVIAKKYNTNKAWILEIYSDSKIRWWVQNVGSTTYSSIFSTTILSTDSWYHIVSVFSRPTLKVYVDGELENSGSWDYDIGNNPSDHLFINSDGANFLNGTIDELRISHTTRNQSWNQAVDNGTILGFLYSYNRAGQNYDFSDSLEPGFGYWLWSYFDCELLISSGKVGSGHISDLMDGWDIVGLPYNVSIAKISVNVTNNSVDYTWDDAVSNNIILGFIYGWNTTDQLFELCDDFVPGRGYWMYAYYGCDLKN